MINLTYEETTYKEVQREINALCMMGYMEVDKYDGQPEPNLDNELLAAIPGIQVIVAKEEGTVVGFHVSMISYDMFYKDQLTAYVMFYYMLPAFRGKGRGIGMFNFAETLYKDKGADRVFMSRKSYIDNEKMFKTLGYTHIEDNYTKVV